MVNYKNPKSKKTHKKKLKYISSFHERKIMIDGYKSIIVKHEKELKIANDKYNETRMKYYKARTNKDKKDIETEMRQHESECKQLKITLQGKRRSLSRFINIQEKEDRKRQMEKILKSMK